MWVGEISKAAFFPHTGWTREVSATNLCRMSAEAVAALVMAAVEHGY